jgi:hypothetical protein
MRATIWGVTRWSGGVPTARTAVVGRRVRLACRRAVEPGDRHPAVLVPAREAHLRTLMAPELTRDDFVPHSVRSHDLDNTSRQVELTAELRRHGRDDLTLEAAVSRLSLEPAVSSPGPPPNPNQPS